MPSTNLQLRNIFTRNFHRFRKYFKKNRTNIWNICIYIVHLLHQLSKTKLDMKREIKITIIGDHNHYALIEQANNRENEIDAGIFLDKDQYEQLRQHFVITNLNVYEYIWSQVFPNKDLHYGDFYEWAKENTNRYLELTMEYYGLTGTNL